MHVGLTQRVLTHNNVSYDSLSLNWYEYLEGHNLTIVPNRLNQDLVQLANDIDLLIITGGNNHPVRDIIETTLVDHLYKLGKPIIGVCHGFQMLTEYFGGTLESTNRHYNTTHNVVYGNKHVSVNSYHTNKIRKLPEGAIPLAYDLDNNCESWIKGNIGGVMWHPERESWLPKEIKDLLNDNNKKEV